jgi:7-methyl-GTP pyrophosphatase
MDIILASSSPYRQRLLHRLQIPFRCLSPQVDETRLEDEAPVEMAARLALEKARVIAALNPDALVIGSDQVAAIGERMMGKPGSHQAATAQLRASSKNKVKFYTGLALVAESAGFEQFHVEPYSVVFRELGEQAIHNYLMRERPYDCAGSFKCEGLGIALFERMQGDDPTSLEGLPLIALTTLLGRAGIDVLHSSWLPDGDEPHQAG